MQETWRDRQLCKHNQPPNNNSALTMVVRAMSSVSNLAIVLMIAADGRVVRVVVHVRVVHAVSASVWGGVGWVGGPRG